MTPVGRPHPLAPSPKHEPTFVACSILLGEGEGFFKGDGGGEATPIPFETLSPLSATRLGFETSLSAERGSGGEVEDGFFACSKCQLGANAGNPSRAAGFRRVTHNNNAASTSVRAISSANTSRQNRIGNRRMSVSEV